jgi:DNA-binding protein Fis
MKANIMSSAPQHILHNTPVLLGRMNHMPPPTDDNAQHTHDLLEESVITLLRQHCPTYLKMDGVPIRLALARAFVRFILERTRGNQARAAELAGFNRNTLRRLIRCFRIDWAFYAAK